MLLPPAGDAEPDVLDAAVFFSEDQGMGDEAADRFRFRIDDVFAIIGRGTVVAGFIEQGSVRVGDRL